MKENKTVEILKKYFSREKTLILAVSGGPDSMYLLELCASHAKKNQWKLVVAHVNHGLRGKESDIDETFVHAAAKKLNLIFETHRLQPITKGNLEEEARNGRYAFLEKIRKQYDAEWIVTAHHRDDNIETVLFNLIRGTSALGLGGMKIASPELHLLRPLLGIDKNEILAYLKKNHIRYRTDKSNKNLNLSRNLLRHKIIPLIEKINPSFRQTMSLNIRDYALLREYFNEETGRWLKENWVKNRMPLEDFLKLSAVLQKTVLANLYKTIHGNTNRFNQKHLEHIMQFLSKKINGTKKEFGSGYFLKIQRTPADSKKWIILSRIISSLA